MGAGVGALGAGLGLFGYLSRGDALARYDASVVAPDVAAARSDAERAQLLFVGGLATAGVGAVVSALGFAVLGD